MPDYDLGKAHGKIVIDLEDKGTDQAERQLAKLEAISKTLDKALSGTRRAVINTYQSFKDLNGGLGPMIRNLQTARAGFNSFASMATRAQRSANVLTADIRKFSNALDLARVIGKAFNIPFLRGADTSKLPVLVQQIMALYGGIQLLRAAQGILLNLASKFDILGIAGRKLTSIVATIGRVTGLSTVFSLVGTAAGTLAARLGLLGRAAFNMAKGLPLIGGLFAKAGTAAGGLGASITGKLIPAMTHFKGTAGIVSKALVDTFNVTERVSRAVTRLAFFTINLKTAFTGFQKLMRLIAKTVAAGALAITGGVNAFQALGVVLLGTGNALKQLSGVIAIVPGLLAIAGAAVGTFIVGIHGVGDALKTVLGDQEAFDEAIKNLAPSAQETLKALRSFKDVLKDIGTDTQQALFEGLGEELERIGGPVLDAVRGGMKDVGGALNTVGKSFINFLGEAQTTTDLQSIFKDTGTTIRNLAKAVQPVMDAFRDLAAVGASMFANLTSGAGNAAQRFADFIRTARNNGDINKWIQQGIQGFKDLWNTIKTIGSVIKSLFQAFGVGGDGALSRLRDLADSFKQVFDAASEGGVQIENFSDHLEAISDKTVDVISYAFSRIGPVIQSLIPVLEQIALKLDKGVRHAVDLLLPPFEFLAKLISGPLAGSFSTLAARAITMVILLKVVRLLASAFAPVIAGASALSTALVSTGAAIGTVAGGFTGVRTAAIVAGASMGRFGTGVANIGKFVPVIGKMQEAFVKSRIGAQGATQGVSVFQKALNVLKGSIASDRAGMAAMGATATAVGRQFTAQGSIITALRAQYIALGEAMRLSMLYAQQTNPALGRAGQAMVVLRANAAALMVQLRLLAAAMAQGVVQGAKAAGNGLKAAGGSLLSITKATGAAAITGLKTLGSTLLSLVGGGVVAGLIAVGVAIYSIVKAAGAASKQQEQLATASSHAAESGRDLANAFIDANGALTSDVTSVLSENLATLRTDLDDTAATGTGFFADLGAGLIDFGKSSIGMSSDVMASNDSLDVIADRAKAAAKAFNTLGYSNDDLAKAVSGSQGDYDALKASLLGIEDGGDAAAAALQESRDTFVATQESMARIGTPALTLQNALQVIGDKAASASDKLGAMRSALEAMGLIETSLNDAMFAIGDSIDSAAEAVTSFTEDGGAFTTLDGRFDTTSENSQKLYEALKPLGDGLIDIASKGGDVNGAYAEMQGTFQALADATGKPIEEIQRLAGTLGALPTNLNIFMALNGATEAQQQLYQVAQEVVRAGGVHDIILNAQTTEAQEALRAAGAQVDVIDAKTGEIKITATADQANAILNSIDLLKGQVLTPGSLPIGVTGAPQATTALQGVEAAANSADGTQAEIDATVSGAQEAIDKVNALGDAAQQAIPPVKVEFQVDPGPAVNAVQGVEGAAAAAQQGFQEFSGIVTKAMSDATASAQGTAQETAAALQGAADSANASGQALGAGFAAGILSQVSAVQAAAAALAGAASAPLPNSPAKTGPFSGKGWTPFRGAALAAGFAQGIASGIPGVSDMADKMANAVSSAIDAIKAQFNYVNAEPVPLAEQTGPVKYVRNTDKTDKELREDNEKKIQDRIESDAQQAREEAQKKAKDDAEKAMFDEKYPDEPKDEKPKSAEAQAKSDVAEAEKADKKAYEDEKKAAADRLEKALQVIEEGNSSQEETANAVGELNKQGYNSDPATVAALNALGNKDASDADVINSLGTIDNTIAAEADEDRKSNLKALRDATLDRRGIEEYDPFEGASTNPVDDTVSLGNDIIGIFDTIKSGLASIKSLGTLLTRGISDTDDITTAVDGVQSIANAFGSIVSTVGNIVGTVASLAAAAGAAIPGIGQVSSAISLITGGISSANGIVDLAQDVFKLGGQILGGALSSLAGGADGALMGDVKFLLDTNDGTLKRWSADNPDDKRSTQIMPGTGNNVKNNGVENLNIYQGPGQDPYRMIDEAMFAVKASSQGAYA